MQGFFNVLMVGRYAGEKRQDELIAACTKCRHAKEIQVILAGRGPLEKKYRRLAEKLPNPIVMSFTSPHVFWKFCTWRIYTFTPPTRKSKP